MATSRMSKMASDVDNRVQFSSWGVVQRLVEGVDVEGRITGGRCAEISLYNRMSACGIRRCAVRGGGRTRCCPG